MATKTASQTPSLLNVLRGVRADLKNAVDRGIDAAEKRTRATAKAAFRFARQVAKRIGGTAKRSK